MNERKNFPRAGGGKQDSREDKLIVKAEFVQGCAAAN